MVKMWKCVVLAMVVLFALASVAAADPPDFTPPGHRYDHGNGGRDVTQIQGQAQGQAQGQIQGQSQNSLNVNTNNNALTNTNTLTNTNMVTNTVEGNKVNVSMQGGSTTTNVGGKAFRQHIFQDSDGFPALPDYQGPWTGPSWNVLPLQYLPKMVTQTIAEGWKKGSRNCEFYPYRPRTKYVHNEFYLKDSGKEGKLPLKAHYELVGFAFCKATFDGTTLSMVGEMASIGMANGATTGVVLGASEEFDPRSWSIGLNLGGTAGWINGNEGDFAYGGRAGVGASYGGASKNKGQGLVFLLVDEWPEPEPVQQPKKK